MTTGTNNGGTSEGINLNDFINKLLATHAQKYRQSYISSDLNGLHIILIAGELNTADLVIALKNDKSKILLGCGSSVEELTNAQTSYEQALIALEAARRDIKRHGRLALWNDLGADRFLMQYPLALVKFENMPKSLQRLFRTRNNADLIHTLEMYLEAGGDGQRTASILHVHRSTFYYRINRLRDILDVDLTDGAVRQDLHTGLRLAQLAGLIS